MSGLFGANAAGRVGYEAPKEDEPSDKQSEIMLQSASLPDVFGNAYLKWDADAVVCAKAIIEAAVDLKLPLEVNAYGFRKPSVESEEGIRSGYPLVPFWEIAAEYDVTVVVNSDAHRPEDIVARVDDAYAIVEQYGLPLADLSAMGVGSAGS